jgi:hypothetical protein
MKRNKILLKTFIGITLFASIFIFLSCNRTQKEPWRALFNGEDLSGWEIVEGKAEPKVVNGIITVDQIDTEFAYLMSTEIFSDFILELDAKLIGELNSGALIRGIRDPQIKNGMTHGFQMEIDQTERRWTGGVTEMNGRSWLTPLDGYPEATLAAYKVSEWNHYRIEAIQDTFKIWVNEVPTTYLIDGMTKEGLIGFQIHRLLPENEPGTLRLKNIRIITDKPQRFSKPISFPPINTGQ